MEQKWGVEEGQLLYSMVQDWFEWVNGQTHVKRNFSNSRSYYASYGPSAFKSGGYTGDWIGDSGKIGVLHQKEMVLNAEDTKNILDSVGILRDLMNNAGINMFARLSSLRSDSYNPLSNNESFEQNVHIDATFPNVDSKREIE